MIASLPFVVALPMVFAFLTGCGSSADKTEVAAPETVRVRPLRAMRSAMLKGEWEKAWTLSEQVLVDHADDPDVLASVARIAHQNGKPDEAAVLLADACRKEAFAKDPRVFQAVVAMVGVGKLHEGIELLEEAIERRPEQHLSRRLLYDLHMGSENRVAGLPHGRHLIRQRQFDLELLMTLSNTERRTQDEKPLDEMISRNPDDKRPQLAAARIQFDEGEYDESVATLRSIVAAHPDYLPAQSLLGRALAADGQYDSLESWSAGQPPSIRDYPGYWIALGDWARGQQQNEEAARSYWEATRRDPDLVESWSKLSTALQQLGPTSETVAGESLDDIGRRVTQLSRFSQLKNRFERTGSISRAIAVEIAETLEGLGRLWEAEAWAAIALSLPEDDAVDVDKVREIIVAQLSADTPWQMAQSHPELSLDLTSLALPAIDSVALAAIASATRRGDSVAGQEGRLRLSNEAIERGLTFFGRTSDRLDQPGIMLFQTLGCGGGTIDYDLDGWPDLYLVNAGGEPPTAESGANALMRNLGGNFTNTTTHSQTGDNGFGQGVAVGDVNADGFADLLVLNYGANTLLINRGDGTFADASDRIAVAGSSWSSSAAIADLDGDGLSDVVIVNYCAGTEPVTQTCPMKDKDIFRACTPVKFAAEPDRFLRAGPDGKYDDRTSVWAEEPTVLGRGLGIVVGTFDHVPGLDVLVANDMTNNHYWSGAGENGQFKLTESGILRGLAGDDRAVAQGSMGIASGDFDRDGDIDFYVTNFEQEYNTYHEQRSEGIWQDRTANQKLISPTMPMVGFGSEAIDLDNDGTLELVVTNGHVDMFSRGEEKSIYAQPLQVFRRNGLGNFDSVATTIGDQYASSPHVGRALWTLDANRDGLTDFAVTHQTEAVALLVNKNESDADWIELQLVGRSCGRDAVGATVRVIASDQSWVATKTAGDGFQCSNESLLRFGLGQIEGPCRVTVTWPDQSTQQFDELDTRSTWLLVQDDEQAFRLE